MFGKIINVHIENNTFSIVFIPKTIKYLRNKLNLLGETMGLFNFLKKKEPRVIEFEELSTWADEYLQSKNISKEINIIKREIKAKIIKLEELLKALKKASPKNPSLFPKRELSIMEGNRDSYIKKIRRYIDKLKLPEDQYEIQSALERLAEEIQLLADDSQKNFFILKEFVEDEARNVAFKLSEFDKLLASSIETLDKTDLSKILRLKALIKEYYTIKTDIQRLQKESEEVERIKLEIYEKIAKIQKKVDVIKKSPHYSEFEELKNRKKQLEEEFSKDTSSVRSMILNVDAAIKKYAKHKKDKLMKEYLNDSINTFIEDEELKLVDHFKKIRDNIGELDLKDSKKEKTEKILSAVTKDDLKKLRNKIISAKEELESIVVRIKNHASNLNLKEQQGWIDNLNESIALENAKIKKIEEQLERLNPRLTKQKIKELLKTLDMDVELK